MNRQQRLHNNLERGLVRSRLYSYFTSIYFLLHFWFESNRVNLKGYWGSILFDQHNMYTYVYVYWTTDLRLTRQKMELKKLLKHSHQCSINRHQKLHNNLERGIVRSRLFSYLTSIYFLPHFWLESNRVTSFGRRNLFKETSLQTITRYVETYSLLLYFFSVL